MLDKAFPSHSLVSRLCQFLQLDLAHSYTTTFVNLCAHWSSGTNDIPEMLPLYSLPLPIKILSIFQGPPHVKGLLS